MSENDEKLQKLLRLKSYETPGEEYFDSVLVQVRQRRRQDHMPQSSAYLLRERVSDWFQNLGPEKWAVPAGSFAAIAVAMFAWGSREHPISENDATEKNGKTETQVFELRLPQDSEGAKEPTTEKKPEGFQPAGLK